MNTNTHKSTQVKVIQQRLMSTKLKTCALWHWVAVASFKVHLYFPTPNPFKYIKVANWHLLSFFK